MADAYRSALSWQPEWIYKKVDSVLRGHVGIEIEAMLAATGQRRGLLVPANPQRQRTIENARYFVRGVPLDQSPLAHDPDHPRRSNQLRDLLPIRSIRLQTCAELGPDLCDGITVPDASSVDQLSKLANQAADYQVVAGAAEFFEALLRARGAAGSRPATQLPPRSMPDGRESIRDERELLVCGSRVAWPERLSQAAECGPRLFALPETWWDDFLARSGDSQHSSSGSPSEWIDRVVACLRDTGRAGIGIGDFDAESSGVRSPIRTDLLLQGLAAAAESVAQRVQVDRWLLEGGATASAVLRRLHFDSCALGAAQESGIGELLHPGPSHVRYYVKPGSYPWPAQLWPGSR
jgi:uncharacterized protein YgbK (DUF1537 family)